MLTFFHRALNRKEGKECSTVDRLNNPCLTSVEDQQQHCRAILMADADTARDEETGLYFCSLPGIQKPVSSILSPKKKKTIIRYLLIGGPDKSHQKPRLSAQSTQPRRMQEMLL